MRIYLFLNDKVLTFTLPSEIAGSFSFDELEDEEDKLINIEARDSQWVLYSTEDVKVMQGTMAISAVPLQENQFYILSRDGKSYLIHAVALLDKHMVAYNYQKNVQLVIGNGENCNVRYACGLIQGVAAVVHYVEDTLTLEKMAKVPIYVNNQIVKENKYALQIGDTIHLYGFKITILPNILLMNKILEGIILLESAANITRSVLEVDSNLEKIEVKDVDLYSKEEYFSKSPRIRRVIETRTLKISAPPKKEGEEELPLILTLGPMLTMGLVSGITLVNTISKVATGRSSLGDSLPSILTASAMLISTLLWPNLTKMYNKKLKDKKNAEIEEKYQLYLSKQEQELMNESKLQKDILIENLVTLEECLKIIQNKTLKFWDKRIDQSDFLVVRVGMGNAKLDVKVDYPEEGFTIEEDNLRKQLDALVKNYEYIQNVPIGYSFYENKVTAIMGVGTKNFDFMNNMILQLITFYSYEDVKLVVFTNEQNKAHWNYVKYLNHNFTNDRGFRFFASTPETAKEVADYLEIEVSRRAQVETPHPIPPYYLIVIDDYEMVKRYGFVKTLTELDANIGFSLVILENRLSRLPSKCNNFISIGETTSGILKNSYEKQEQITFYDEIKKDIDMMALARIVSNVPIEFEESVGQLPDSITFLEMEKVGKVEQLNILNRWNTNDSTTSLKAEIGVDEQGKWMNLDLHEKYHGPHGLIAGMTGSGKSEFIITYILSMAINYSPDDVVFILIDYKGGGLAFAFENKVTGVCLPHLAGTITNLDKAEMDRTLVSIDSEVKRRQQKFNEARDQLGESTIDIYKYQRFFHEGKLSEPIPHLFIVCDEFAELKSQQPDFMDNLISIARIGRSLGVHLILATQKPTGVVNDQIWSNSKFHICLKVQDASDSNEMLKRPDAANLKQTGRFYLQVGYNEFFALGQSAWCGAKYFPSDRIVKQVDKSVNFINDNGFHIKNIQYSTGNKAAAKGEQIAAVMGEIIETANKTHKYAKRLWLDNIPELILIDQLYTKYQSSFQPGQIQAILGEYDAPEKQEQGILLYNMVEDGNTAIYGMDGSEYEMMLNAIIYSTIMQYSPETIQYYMIDYGSQTLRRYEKAPHVGGIVCAGEDEKYNSFFKMLRKELDVRKKKLSDLGVDYKAYRQDHKDMPLMVNIFNNFDSINDSDKNLYEKLPEYIRDSERYGVIFLFTATGVNSIPKRVSQNLNNNYALRLKDATDYPLLFTSRKKILPRAMNGRGLFEGDDVHEFQTASIIEDSAKLTEFIRMKIERLNAKYTVHAKKIPVLPEQVVLTDVESAIKNLNKVPIGIDKTSLEISKYNFTNSVGTLITSHKLKNTLPFVLSLIEVMSRISNLKIMVFDPVGALVSKKETVQYIEGQKIEESLEQLNQSIQNLINQHANQEGIIYLYNMTKILDAVSDKTKLENLFSLAKQYEKIRIIVLDDVGKLKNYTFDKWYQGYFSATDGIYVGKGVSDQNLMKIANFNSELTKPYENNIGFNISESSYTIIKLLEFERIEEDEDE